MKKTIFLFSVIFAYAGVYEDEVHKLFTDTGRSQIMHCQYEMGEWKDRTASIYHKIFEEFQDWTFLERTGGCIKCGRQNSQSKSCSYVDGGKGHVPREDVKDMLARLNNERQQAIEKDGKEIILGEEICGNPGVPKDSILYPLICYAQYKASSCWQCWRNEDDDWADWKANILKFAKFADRGIIRFTQREDSNGVVHVEMKTDITSLLDQEL